MRPPSTALLAVPFLPFTSAIPYSEYILAPSQRVLAPALVHRVNGTVSNAGGVTTSSSTGGGTTFGAASAVTYDYTKNIGGLVSFVVSSVSEANQYIGISFSESSEWISPDGSDATQNVAIDETLWFAVTSPGNYTVDEKHQRGGFRYLNVYHNNTNGNVTLSELTTYFTALPQMTDMRAYTGYFHSNDEQLNRVWYASAYTDQLCTIPATAGDSLVDLNASNPDVPTYWWANSTLTNGTAALVDGAKRDKLIWPGDISISVPGVFLSTNDALTVKLSLEQLYADQNATTGKLPYVAKPIVVEPLDAFTVGISGVYSFTYHLYNLLGLNNYYIYTNDLAFLEQQWYRVQLGLNLSLSSIDSTGLAYVGDNATADWLRVGMGAHNIEANSILYYTINTVISLAHAVGDTSLVDTWTSYAAGIKAGANALLWDASAGFYKDNETTTLYPQDGNSWAIVSGVANASQAATISSNLASRWGPYGAPAPEAGTTVSPFISGFELQAHFVAGQPQLALDLMKFMWAGFMLDDPRMTNSTFIEGYDVSGALHYPAYEDDARISHAHGWSTGPIIALTNFAAGLHVINATHWMVHPQPGNLTSVDAGFTLAFGTFSATYAASNGGRSVQYQFSTPQGTTGSVVLDVPACNAVVQVQSANGTSGYGGMGGCECWGGPQAGVQGPATAVVDNVPGGSYVVNIQCQ